MDLFEFSKQFGAIKEEPAKIIIKQIVQHCIDMREHAASLPRRLRALASAEAMSFQINEALIMQQGRHIQLRTRIALLQDPLFCSAKGESMKGACKGT